MKFLTYNHTLLYCLVLLKFTQISSPAKGSQENVHTGALPPWLDASEKEICQLNTGPYPNKLATSSTQAGKSRTLNPKRVGAAWADRRRVELEMEKRGERVPNSFDANWLPNFGRVWQEGTRRESEKEFKMEKRKFLEDNNQLDLPFKVQPYISKRMVTFFYYFLICGLHFHILLSDPNVLQIGSKT